MLELIFIVARLYVVRSNRNRKVRFTRLGGVGRLRDIKDEMKRKPLWVTFLFIPPFYGVNKTGTFVCKSLCLLDPLQI